MSEIIRQTIRQTIADYRIVIHCIKTKKCKNNQFKKWEQNN